MKAYDLPVWQTVAAALAGGETIAALELRLAKSRTFIKKVRRRMRRGEPLGPQPRRNGPIPTIGEGDLERLRQYVLTQPHATRVQIRTALGWTVHVSQITRARQKLERRGLLLPRRRRAGPAPVGVCLGRQIMVLVTEPTAGLVLRVAAGGAGGGAGSVVAPAAGALVGS